MSAKQKYEAALAAGDWATAESLLRQGLAESGDARILVMLGTFLRNRGRFADAEAVLAPAADTAPTPEILDILSLVQYEQQNFADSEKNLELLVALKPAAELRTYQILAKLKSTRLGPQGAREVMQRALAAHPGSTEFTAAYADTLPAGEAAAELERHLGEVRGDPGRTAYLLHRLTTLRAPRLRAERGLPRDYGISWPDTYQWPDTELLAQLKNALIAETTQGTRRAAAWLDLSNVALAEGNWELAEKYLAELRSTSKQTPANFSGFGKHFHAELKAMSDADILAGLARLERLASPPARGNETVFMGSDQKYFARFTLPFLQQLEAARIPLDVHVHILDGDASEWKEVLAAVAGLQTVGVTLTAEASGALAKSRTYGRLYYHAIRYVRCFQELKRSQRPMWVLDCDAQLLRDPRPLFSAMGSYDLAFRTSPAMFYPTLKINASCVGFAPTDLGLAFARQVASYIIYWKDRGTWGWGVDQAALFSCFAHMSDQGRTPRTLFLDETAMNNVTGDTGMIRFMSGIGKHVTAADASTT